MAKNISAIIACVLILLFVGLYGSGSFPALENIRGGGVSERALRCRDCNLIVISLTNTRKDHVGVYGYERDTTPNIDAYFKDALILENMFSPASWTLPVAASFMSSLYPYAHNVMYRTQKNVLSEDVLTLPEILRREGYATAAFTGGGDYNRRYGMAQGFGIYVDEENYDTFDINFSPPNFTRNDAYLSMEYLIPRAVDWLEGNKNKKKFLFLQGFDTHCPFTPRPPFDKKFGDAYLTSTADFSNCLWTFAPTEPVYENGVRYWPLKSWYVKKGAKDVRITDDDVARMVDLYDGEIAQADANLAPLFAAIKNLGLEKNTIVIFMSEHGDMFGEHGRFMRGGPLRGTFYDQVLNVPFLIKHPKVRASARIDALVQTVDVLPTILDMLRVEDDGAPSRQGKSVLASLANTKVETNDYAYAGSLYRAVNNAFFSGESVVEMVRNKEWKLIKEMVYAEKTGEKISETYELYNVSTDVKETENRYEEEPAVAEYFTQKLGTWRDDTIKQVKKMGVSEGILPKDSEGSPKIYSVVTGPAIIRDEGLYKMWYMWNASGIGYATSTDGIRWEKYAGNPVLYRGDRGAWDGTSMGTPEVKKRNGTYHMWYRADSPSYQRIGYATSTDGIRWEKYGGNPVFGPAAGKWDSVAVIDSSILFENGVYKLWYRGSEEYDQAPSSIGLSMSKDGILWERYVQNPIIEPSANGTWDDKLVGDQTVLKENGTYKMWYSGTSYAKERREDAKWKNQIWQVREGWEKEIGYAVSADGVRWQTYAKNPVLKIGNPGEWDSVKADNPFVLFEDGIYKMWYRGSNGGIDSIGYATSTDGILWEKYGGNPVLLP